MVTVLLVFCVGCWRSFGLAFQRGLPCQIAWSSIVLVFLRGLVWLARLSSHGLAQRKGFVAWLVAVVG